jgi:hypothetical protein
LEGVVILCWLALTALFITDAHAEDPRIAIIRQVYVARCATDLLKQGMPRQKAEAVCGCVFTGVMAEVQYGIPGDEERYKRLMSAQPNPNGSAEDQALYKIVSPCFAD